MDAINDFIMQAATSGWVVPVMFALALLDGFFPPVPSETVLVASAAVAVSTGSWASLLLLCLAAAAGALIGDNVTYAIGRRVGTARLQWMQHPRVETTISRARGALESRGAPLILGARYIPVGRVAVNLTAGAVRYPWRRFLPLSAVAAASWSVYSAVIGVAAGHWLEKQPLLSAVIGVAFALALGVVIDGVARRRRRKTELATASDAATEQGQLEPVEQEPVISS